MNRGSAVLLAALALALAPAAQAHAHTTVEVGPYEIEAGWGTEPPVVGLRNTFVFEVSLPGEAEGVKEGVRGAFKSLDATARFGGASKALDVNSAPAPGHYYSSVIPTRAGSYSVEIVGALGDTAVDVEIPVEDVETTAVLDFPPRAAGGGRGAAEDSPAHRSLHEGIQRDIGALESRLGGTGEGASLDAGPAYDAAVLGLSLAAAAAVLSVAAMLRKR